MIIELVKELFFFSLMKKFCYKDYLEMFLILVEIY